MKATVTTPTRPSRIVYTVFAGAFIVGEADDREGAEVLRDAHAARNNNDPLSERYVITPVLRKEKE